jgi:hypothetical protein
MDSFGFHYFCSSKVCRSINLSVLAALMSLGGAVGAFVAFAIVDRIGRRATVIAGLIIAAVLSRVRPGDHTGRCGGDRLHTLQPGVFPAGDASGRLSSGVVSDVCACPLQRNLHRYRTSHDARYTIPDYPRPLLPPSQYGREQWRYQPSKRAIV